MKNLLSQDYNDKRILCNLHGLHVYSLDREAKNSNTCRGYSFIKKIPYVGLNKKPKCEKLLTIDDDIMIIVRNSTG